MTDIVARMKALPDLTNEKAWEVVTEGAQEIERLRAALSDARPFVADSGDDEDPDASRSASEVVAEIDRLIPSR